MKEGKEWLNELDASLGETPDMFHRRVEQTLRILQTERTEACTTEKKGEWSNRPACSAAPTICRRCSGKVHRRIGFHHQHEAKNWVLDDAGAMVHTEDGDRVSIGACTASIREWVCDGQRLFATIGVIDPALATEGYYVPEDEDEDYLAGLEHYGLTHELMEASSDDGYVQVRSADFDWGDETRFEILYTYEIELETCRAPLP